MSELPVIGALAIYAPLNLSARTTDTGAELGHVVPLRLGERVLVGRVRRPYAEVGDRKIPVTGHVLYPDREPYLSISRQHMLLEVLEGGVTRITDTSSAGFFAFHRNEYVRSPRGQFTTIECAGEEMLYLASPLLERDTSEGQLEIAMPNRIQLLRFDTAAE